MQAMQTTCTVSRWKWKGDSGSRKQIIAWPNCTLIARFFPILPMLTVEMLAAARMLRARIVRARLQQRPSWAQQEQQEVEESLMPFVRFQVSQGLRLIFFRSPFRPFLVAWWTLVVVSSRQ